MANPTAAASANKTGKTRKKTELPGPQIIAKQAKPNSAKANQVKPAQVNPAQANLGQTGPGQVFGQTRKTTTKSGSNDLGQKPGHKEVVASGRKTAASSASKPKAASAFGPVSDNSPVFNNEKDTLVLTNCTNSPRGIAFKNGIVLLQPREMRLVPADQQDEVRELFKNPTFQRFVDHGIFRLSSIGDDEQSTVVKTPAPPQALTQEVCLNELQMSIGTSTGSRATSPKVVAYQQGGALPDVDNSADNIPGSVPGSVTGLGLEAN